MDSDTVAESDMSLKSSSFLHRVNDRVRKMLDQSSKDAAQDSNKHSLIWRMFMSSTLEASVFMGKNYLENLHSVKNTGNNLSLKQMFDISEKLIVGQSDEIYGVNTINWEDSSWKHLSFVGDEEIISLSHAKVYVFSDSVLCLGKMNQNAQSKLSGKTSWRGSRVHHNTELWTQLMVSQWNSSGIFPRIHHIAALQQSPRVLVKMSEEPEEFTGRIIFMSMFNDVSWVISRQWTGMRI